MFAGQMQGAQNYFTHQVPKTSLSGLSHNNRLRGTRLIRPQQLCKLQKVVQCRQSRLGSNEGQANSNHWLSVLGLSCIIDLEARAEDFEVTETIVKSGGQDWIISAAFTTAIIALGAVTLGVSHETAMYSVF